MTVFNYLDELPEDIMQALSVTEGYRRFTAEQTKLSALAAKALSDTGTLNSPEILKQEKLVTQLGEDVLEQIRRIELLSDKPTAP